MMILGEQVYKSETSTGKLTDDDIQKLLQWEKQKTEENVPEKQYFDYYVRCNNTLYGINYFVVASYREKLLFSYNIGKNEKFRGIMIDDKMYTINVPEQVVNNIVDLNCIPTDIESTYIRRVLAQTENDSLMNNIARKFKLLNIKLSDDISSVLFLQESTRT